jgi:hypothetical protein
MAVGTGVTLLVASAVIGILGVALFSTAFAFLFGAFILLVAGVVIIAIGDRNETPGEHFHMGRPFHHYRPPPPPPPHAQGVLDRYCPECGSGNQRISHFCHACGQALPPPP